MGVLIAIYYPIVGDTPQWGLAAALAVAGAIFGTWTSTMICVSTPSKRLARFMPEIEKGKILLMVDVLMWQGTDPDIPAFP